MEFQLHICPSNKYSGLISFRMDWLESPCRPRDSQESSPTPQFKSFNSLVLSFLCGPLSHPYMTTGKTIALMRRTFVGKVMSLSFSMLFRLVIAFLHRIKEVQGSFNFLAAVTICSDFGAQKYKVSHCFYYFLIYFS